MGKKDSLKEISLPRNHKVKKTIESEAQSERIVIRLGKRKREFNEIQSKVKRVSTTKYKYRKRKHSLVELESNASAPQELLKTSIISRQIKKKKQRNSVALEENGKEITLDETQCVTN